MQILVINSGSSSIKFKLFNMPEGSVRVSGLLEMIGEPQSRLAYRCFDGGTEREKHVDTELVPDHQTGFRRIYAALEKSGAVRQGGELAGIGHRVVHGGEKFQEPTIIDHDVIAAVRRLAPLAPLHNPANLMGINVARELFPHAPQVAVFDTAFHQTIPAFAYHYALPWSYYEELGVRRYGFHGTSHQYVAREAATLLGKPLETVNLITAHLGSGASICSIEQGISVDTSMGMTPLGGLIMGTRGGDLDPGVLMHIADRKEMSLHEINTVLQTESGLKGICGMNDMRDIHGAADNGDTRAQLALDMFVHRCRQVIGAYFFQLGKVDALVFTAGVGEKDAAIRESCCKGMTTFGLTLDPSRNHNPDKHRGEITSAGSPIKAYVIPTNEELEIARQTVEVVNGEG